MKSKELIKYLEQARFIFVRQSGSHAIYRNFDGKIIVVPIYNRNIPIGTLNSILKDAGLR